MQSGSWLRLVPAIGAMLAILVLVAGLRNAWTIQSNDYADHCIESKLRVTLTRQILDGQVGWGDLLRGVDHVSKAVRDPLSPTGATFAETRVQNTLYPLHSFSH